MFTFLAFERVELGSRWTEVNPEIAFFQEQRKPVFWDAVVFTQPTLGLVPEVLNTIDVLLFVCKQFAMIDAEVAELCNVNRVMGLPLG